MDSGYHLAVKTLLVVFISAGWGLLVEVPTMGGASHHPCTSTAHTTHSHQPLHTPPHPIFTRRSGSPSQAGLRLIPRLIPRRLPPVPCRCSTGTSSFAWRPLSIDGRTTARQSTMRRTSYARSSPFSSSMASYGTCRQLPTATSSSPPAAPHLPTCRLRPAACALPPVSATNHPRSPFAPTAVGMPSCTFYLPLQVLSTCLPAHPVWDTPGACPGLAS